jgi:hypothetical protein
MMNEARIAVGLGATMLGMAGYEASLAYARERPQGRPVGASGKDATRWTGKELLNGYKILPINRKILLEDAIYLSTYYNNLYKKENGFVIKIDIYRDIGNKILEYGNLINFYYNDGQNLRKDLTYKGYLDTTFQSISSELTNYLYQITPKYNNFIKYTKRLYVLARINKDMNTIKQLTNFFHTDINFLNGINNEIKLIITMLKTYKNAPMNTIYKQLDNLKFNISSIIYVNIDHQKLYYIINDIIEKQKKYNNEKIVEILEDLSDYLDQIVNDKTKEYLINNKLLPPKKIYYDENLISILEKK